MLLNKEKEEEEEVFLLSSIPSGEETTSRIAHPARMMMKFRRDFGDSKKNR